MKNEMVVDFINRRIIRTVTPIKINDFMAELKKKDNTLNTNSFYQIEVMERILTEMEVKLNWVK